MIQDLLDKLLDAQWLQDFLLFLFGIIIGIVEVILLPITVLIETTIPAFPEALAKLTTVFSYAAEYAGWIISAFAIPPILLSMILGYYTFLITTKLTTYGLKLGLKWYSTLK